MLNVFKITISTIVISFSGCFEHDQQQISYDGINWQQARLKSDIEVQIGRPENPIDFLDVSPGYYSQETPIETASSHFSLLIYGEGRQDFLRWAELYDSPSAFILQAESSLDGEKYFDNSLNTLRRFHKSGYLRSMPLIGIARYENYCILYIRDIVGSHRGSEIADIHTTINCIQIDGRWKIVMSPPAFLSEMIDIPIIRNRFSVFEQ